MALNLANLGNVLGGAFGGMLGATPVGGAISGALGAAGVTTGRGVTGGTVVARGKHLLMIRTPAGRNVLVRTQSRRRYYPRHRSTRTDKLMELAMIKAITK